MICGLEEIYLAISTVARKGKGTFCNFLVVCINQTQNVIWSRQKSQMSTKYISKLIKQSQALMSFLKHP